MHHACSYDDINNGQGGVKMIAGVPYWVIAMIVFICFSGYMAFRAIRAEYKLEQEYIEKEGKVYMDRIAEDRKKKDDPQELLG